jgi:hypothetical protein
MSVEFDEDKFQYGRTGVRPGMQNMQSGAQSGMSLWLIKKGIVKSDTGAQVVLVAIVIINILIVFLVFKYFI